MDKVREGPFLVDERYTSLLNESPDLLKRAPLKFIASYLGITQTSLSRIRHKR